MTSERSTGGESSPTSARIEQPDARLSVDYAARLRIPRPRLEDLVSRRGVRLFHLMIAALIEHGGPMPRADIARRLAQAGLAYDGDDLERSLEKAWHGLAPVYRDPAGRFALDLSSRELDLLLFMIGLRPPRVAPVPEPPRAEPTPVGDDVALSANEVETAFRDRYLGSMTPLRQAAAVLDASGQAMTLDEVDAVLARLTRHRVRLTIDGARYWRSRPRLVTVDAEGRLTGWDRRRAHRRRRSGSTSGAGRSRSPRPCSSRARPASADRSGTTRECARTWPPATTPASAVASRRT